MACFENLITITFAAVFALGLFPVSELGQAFLYELIERCFRRVFMGRRIFSFTKVVLCISVFSWLPTFVFAADQAAPSAWNAIARSRPTSFPIGS